MKHLRLLIGISWFLNIQHINAQDIFKQHGFDKKPLTLSNGHYNEFFNNDKVVQIGTVLLNTQTNQIIAFIDEDTTRALYLADLSSRWLSPDPLAAKYPQLSPYIYAANNPLIYIDVDGRDILFINGYIGFGSPAAGQAYWNNSFVNGAKNYFHDNNAKFTNFEPAMFSSAAERKAAGMEYAKSHFGELTKGMAKDKDVFRMVTHSMGAAFGEGIAEYMKGDGWSVETIVHIDAFQANDITTTDPNSNAETNTIDYQNPDDWVINNTPTASPGDIKGADVKIREQSGDGNWKTRHTSPIWKQGSGFWQKLNNKILNSTPKDSPIPNPNDKEKTKQG